MRDETTIGRADDLVSGRRFGSLRGLNGNLLLASQAMTPPKSYPSPQLVPLNEVLPYAGLPLASEIIHIFLRCHAPASQ